jgi:hypothetical protein
VWFGAGNELIFSAAIWALRFPDFGDVQENSWMRVPGWSLIGGAMQWQVFAIHHHNLGLSHLYFPDYLT